MKFNFFLFFKLTALIFISLGARGLQAQEVVIELGRNRLPITEYFTISVKLRNVPLNKIGDFPEIDGFQKSSRNKTKARIEAGKKTSIEETITQNYAALKEGRFLLKPFNIEVNGKNIASAGTTIRIEPEPASPAPPGLPTKPGEVIPTPLNKTPNPEKSLSYLTLQTNKNRVYVGEGLRVQLYFHVAAAEQGLLDFYNFGNQLAAITKQLQPASVWEDVIEQKEVKADTVIINKQEFIRFKLYDRIFYPLTAAPLQFPAVVLTMARYSENQDYAALNRQQELVPFNTAPKTVTVQVLPPHSLREIVPVGQFTLREGINQTVFRTDKSFNYSFEVMGTGNLAALNMPEIISQEAIDIYPPAIQQFNSRFEPGSGRKIFKYTLLAKTPGVYDLSKLFWMPFFNPVTGRYDTLRSELEIKVTGVQDAVSRLKPEEADAFYQLIGTENNELTDLNQFKEVKLYANLVILLLICASLYVFFKK